MQNYEIRKHFEAALHDLAILYNVDKKRLKGGFKLLLSEKKIIKESTTELTDHQLKSLADKLSLYHYRMSNTPPCERGNLNKNELNIILNLKPRNEVQRNMPLVPKRESGLHPRTQ